MAAERAVLCLGWDVGGWMGGKQGAAAVLWDPASPSVQWVATPRDFRLKAGTHLTFPDFVTLATGGSWPWPTQSARCVVGIDAPLGYPVAYRRLVAGAQVDGSCPTREIDNILAYRDTERHIFERFGKKPLSAPFDKLGNNASVAVSHVRRWATEEELRVAPFEEVGSGHVAIEVYPALSKSRDGLAPALATWLPNEVTPGTDSFDAAISALIALAFAADGAIKGLPRVVHPPAELPTCREEGWIYYLSGAPMNGEDREASR